MNNSGSEFHEPVLDRDTAEQALLLAARLQQQHGEGLTVSQLKQAAAEADISPHFVDQALQAIATGGHMSRMPEVKPSLRRVLLTETLPVALLFAFQCWVAQYVADRPLFSELPAVMLALAVAALAGFAIPRGKRPMLVGVAALSAWFIVVTIYNWLIAVESRTPTLLTDPLMRSALVLAGQIALFVTVRGRHKDARKIDSAAPVAGTE